MKPPPYLPTVHGLDALEELDRVDWSTLQHAYGLGIAGNDLSGDVSRGLAMLANDWKTAFDDGLWSSLCHQGTVYEASAYALPFLAAVAAGPVTSELRQYLVSFIGDIVIGGSYVAPSGSSAGSWGQNVDTLIQQTTASCDAYFSSIVVADESYASLIDALRRLTKEPSGSNRQDVWTIIDPE